MKTIPEIHNLCSKYKPTQPFKDLLSGTVFYISYNAFKLLLFGLLCFILTLFYVTFNLLIFSEEKKKKECSLMFVLADLYKLNVTMIMFHA